MQRYRLRAERFAAEVRRRGGVATIHRSAVNWTAVPTTTDTTDSPDTEEPA